MIFIDTHVAVWLYAGIKEKIPENAAQHIEDDDVYVSQMVRLEIQYLYEIGRITAKPSVLLKGLSRTIGLRVNNGVSVDVFDHAIRLDWPRDVFDRVITAEAIFHNARLITKDKKIRANYKLAIWD